MVRLMMLAFISPLSDEDIAAINGGAGDMGVVGTLDAPVITQDSTISINLSFSKLAPGGRNRIGCF